MRVSDKLSNFRHGGMSPTSIHALYEHFTAPAKRASDHGIRAPARNRVCSLISTAWCPTILMRHTSQGDSTNLVLILPARSSSLFVPTLENPQCVRQLTLGDRPAHLGSTVIRSQYNPHHHTHHLTSTSPFLLTLPLARSSFRGQILHAGLPLIT